MKFKPLNILSGFISLGLMLLMSVGSEPRSADQPQQAEFFTLLLFFSIFLVLSTILKPKPNAENAKPAGLGDFKFPTAMEGRPVPVIWGTVKQEGPNVVWYDDLRQTPITQKIKSGLFSSRRVTTGYRYYLGVQMALCRGGETPVGNLLRIWVGDSVLWTGNVSADATAIDIDEPDFLGGNDLGSGGIVGTLRFFSGSAMQPVSTYLSNHQVVGGATPAYRGTCHVVWEGGYLGNSTSIKPWSFELRRIPNGLGLASPSVNGGNDANPMNVIYEILTNDEWGLGFPASDIDIVDFTDNADTLRTEGNGFSFLLDGQIEIQELLRQIEQQIDGVVYLDRATGKWKCNLARGGYTLGNLRQIGPIVKQVRNFSRGSWDDTSNNVLVKFNDRALDYKETYAPAQDMANIRLQGNKVVTVETLYPGVKDATLGLNIAWRRLRTLAYPIARAEVVVDRTLWDHNPGDVVRWTDPDLGFTDLPMRITKIDLGRLTEGEITVTMVQDIFVFDTGSFTAPGVTKWTPPAQAVVAIPTADSLVFEAPRKFIELDLEQPGVPDRVWCGARFQNDAAVDIDVVSRPGSGTYTDAGDVSGFLVAGELASGVDASGTQGSISLTLDPDLDSLPLLAEAMEPAATAEDIGQRLTNIVLVGNEFFAFANVATSGGQLLLTNGYRGLLDTAPASHAANDRAWILLGNLTDRAFTPGGAVDVKLLPRSPRDALAEGSATAVNLTMSNRYRRPYPPVALRLQGSLYPAGSVSLDTSFGSGLDNLGVAATWIRRDWRNEDEAAAVTDESSLPSDFPSANTTQYAIEVRNDPAGANTLLFTTPWNAGTAGIDVSRTRILRFTSGVVPSTMRFRVKTRHVVAGVTYEATQTTDWDFSTASAALSGDFNFGVLSNGVDSADFTAPSTNTYTVNIGTALSSGNVEYRLNGGSWTTVVAAGNTTGNFAATSGDTIEVRHTQTGSTDSQTFLELVVGGSSVAYAVLTY